MPQPQPQQYLDPVCNIYSDHVVVTFKDPAYPGRRMLLLDIRQAVGEVTSEMPGAEDKLGTAIAEAKRRGGGVDPLPKAPHDESATGTKFTNISSQPGDAAPDPVASKDAAPKDATQPPPAPAKPPAETAPVTDSSKSTVPDKPPAETAN